MALAIMVMEFKGFTAIATTLAKNMDLIRITPDRVRAAGITIVNQIIQRGSSIVSPIQVKHIGGDTWVLEFTGIEESLIFGCHLLTTFLDQANNYGIYFLKPCIALAWGDSKWKDDRPIDNETINAYSVADKGRPYHFYLLGDMYHKSKQFLWIKHGSSWTDAPIELEVFDCDWQNSIPPNKPVLSSSSILLPTLLLDSDVIYANTPESVISNILREQASAKEIYAFGGSAPYDLAPYRNYLIETIRLVKTKTIKLSVLACLPINEAKYSFAWLELGRRLMIEYSDTFSFSAFTVPADQIRPISYQIFDNQLVYIGLRSFIPQMGRHSMTSGIMVRNLHIAQSFATEFLEDWRIFGKLNDKKYGELVTSLEGLSEGDKKEVMSAINRILI